MGNPEILNLPPDSFRYPQNSFGKMGFLDKLPLAIILIKESSTLKYYFLFVHLQNNDIF